MELGHADGAALARLEVELCGAGGAVAHGTGSDALGGPVEAVAWLLRLDGVEKLDAGSVVTTGTLTAPFSISPGESWSIDANGPVALRELTVSFC